MVGCASWRRWPRTTPRSGCASLQDHPERLDHLGVELEFVGALCAKEAYAWEAGQLEPAAICREARERFVATHLAGWLPEFVARLKANARLAFYPAVMALALTLVQTERGELAAGAVRE
ncbi:MAG: molecular chaperone TorD family protein [Chloroflexi bacterium]|nr:molecular chaperone TorD family protein [Chloroflexota bacterium]